MAKIWNNKYELIIIKSQEKVLFIVYRLYVQLFKRIIKDGDVLVPTCKLQIFEHNIKNKL